jgi:hypothetical protein
LEDWRVIDRLGHIADYFLVKERLQKLHHTAHIVKIQLGNQGMGKPLVDQYEQFKQIAIDMIANTKEIIVEYIDDRKQKERKLNILHDFVHSTCSYFVDLTIIVVLRSALDDVRFFSNSNSDGFDFCGFGRPKVCSTPKISLQLLLMRLSKEYNRIGLRIALS